MSAIRILLRNSIDYAGLFPPAGLAMDAAVDNYHRYRAGEAAWALGRFILPASRLAQFERAAAERLSQRAAGQPWLLGVLAGPDLEAELERVAEFNRRHAGRGAARIDTIEAKASSADAIRDTMHLMPRDLQAYFEIPIETPIQPKLDVSAFQRVLVAGFISGGMGLPSMPGIVPTMRVSRVPSANASTLERRLRSNLTGDVLFGAFDRGRQIGPWRTHDRSGKVVKETDFGVGRAEPRP